MGVGQLSPPAVAGLISHGDPRMREALAPLLRSATGQEIHDFEDHEVQQYRKVIDPYEIADSPILKRFVEEANLADMDRSVVVRTYDLLNKATTRAWAMLSMRLSTIITAVGVDGASTVMGLASDDLLEALSGVNRVRLINTTYRITQVLTSTRVKTLVEVGGVTLKDYDRAQLGWEFLTFSLLEDLFQQVMMIRIRRDRDVTARRRREAEKADHRRAAEEAERRARIKASAKPSPPDYTGHDSKPDPLSLTTEAEVMDALRRYRVWAGNKSLRELSIMVDNAVSHATFGNLLSSDKLPAKMFHLLALITAIGGDGEDHARWATAWRHFRVPGPGITKEKSDEAQRHLRLTG